MDLLVPPSPRPEVVTLHDVVAWKFADESAPVAAAADELRRAAAVVCVSRFTAGEAKDVLGLENTVVVPNGVDPSFFDADVLAEDDRRRWGLDGRFVLVSGGASKRKNLEALAAAWVDVRRADPSLVLVMSGPDHPRRTTLFGSLPGVRLIGRVSGDLVPRLMASASVVVVPSRYEGFGLPALEAMAAGAPLVAAATSSLPEVVGGCGTLVEPTPAGLSAGILHVLSGGEDIEQKALQGRVRARGFTWDRSAREHAALWRRVADLS
nr:glycosyltransferase family 1 protein [Nocardioides litoris]